MRSVSFTVIAVAVPTLACDQALARRITLSGTHGKQEVKAACGKFYHEDSGGYGCATNCHGGMGTDCAVGCQNNGKCYGQVPLRGRSSPTLGGILHPPLAGVKSSGGNAPPKTHRHPVNVGAANPPTKVKTPIATGKGGGMNQSGGHRH